MFNVASSNILLEKMVAMKSTHTQLALSVWLLCCISCAHAACKKCEQITSHKNGRAVCDCRPGYVISSTDSTKCQDIDECKDQTPSPCQQICTNSVGGYTCSCNPGYSSSTTDTTRCEIVIAAYQRELANYYPPTTHKACFDACASDPMCTRYNYKVATSCFTYYVYGDSTDTSLDSAASPTFLWRIQTAQCIPHASSQDTTISSTNHKACFDTCKLDGLCAGYTYDGSGGCTLHHYAAAGVDTSIEQSTQAFVLCK